MRVSASVSVGLVVAGARDPGKWPIGKFFVTWITDPKAQQAPSHALDRSTGILPVRSPGVSPGIRRDAARLSVPRSASRYHETEYRDHGRKRTLNARQVDYQLAGK